MRAGRARKGRKEHTANNMASAARESPERSGPVSMQYAKVLLAFLTPLVYRRPTSLPLASSHAVCYGMSVSLSLSLSLSLSSLHLLPSGPL